MRTIYLSLTNLVHGLFTSMVLLVLADVWSPTFNVEGIPAWTGSQAMFVFLAALTVSFALGVVMHTISRGLFHKQKGRWTVEILGSRAVRNRLAALGRVHPLRGGPTFADLWEEEDPDDRAVVAAAFMHGVEYQLMVRAPPVKSRVVCKSERKLLDASVRLPWRPPWAQGVRGPGNGARSRPQ